MSEGVSARFGFIIENNTFTYHSPIKIVFEVAFFIKVDQLDIVAI